MANGAGTTPESVASADPVAPSAGGSLSAPALQPALHRLLTCVAAPCVVLSDRSGDLDDSDAADSAQGLFHGDRRLLSRMVLRVDGECPEPVLGSATGTGAARFVSLPRRLTDRGADPVVSIERVRTVTPAGMSEDIVVTSRRADTLRCTVTIELAGDGAAIETVKQGMVPPLATPPRTVMGDGPPILRWDHIDSGVVVTAHNAHLSVDATAGCITWPVEIVGNGRAILQWQAVVTSPESEGAPAHDVTGSGSSPADGGGRRQVSVTAPATSLPWGVPTLRADDRRLQRLLERSLADLDGLRISSDTTPDAQLLAAGAPWYLTIFGRDSLWAARMMLPLGTTLAVGTLRTLAAHQGVHHDLATAEEPGRILHEVRRAPVRFTSGMHLPPVYYGTVDATPLWVCLLHDAWRAGMDVEDIARLLPHLEAALEWLADSVGSDESGFLRYVDRSGRGLANQGWKDSGDSIRFRDGTIASAPVALSEVQAYAVAAARAGADLLALLGRPGHDRWLQWADDLATRFRTSFWVTDDIGPFPALALDGEGRPVDSPTSNMGHLLGTGLLDVDEEALVSARLRAPDMADAWGLRTMSRAVEGYAPLSYHCGSVWPHDTAIAIGGLVRTGHASTAAVLIDGLLGAAEAFDHRLPELWSGDPASDGPPVPYPAACRPQAWSAASSVVILTALLGLEVDVPSGVVSVAPMRPSPVGSFDLYGLPVADGMLDISVSSSGEVLSTRWTGSHSLVLRS